MGGCAGKHKSKSAQIKHETKSKDDKSQLKSENALLSNDSNLKEHDEINKAISQILPSHIVSVSDSELDIEFANLVYGHPENEYTENPKIATKFRSAEV